MIANGVDSIKDAFKAIGVATDVKWDGNDMKASYPPTVKIEVHRPLPNGVH